VTVIATPAADAIAIPATSPVSIGTAQVADGTQLRTLHWSAAGEPWAVAEIVHGLGEHGGRYETVARALTRAGIEMWSYDHRGNGGSGGRRGWVESWPILHDDLQARLEWLRAQYPGLPLVLYGHSMGGLIAAGYVLSEVQRPLPDLLVLSAPGFDDNLAAWKHSLARVLSSVVPKMKLKNGVPMGAVSRDPKIDELSAADPLCSDSSTVRMGAEAFAEQDRVKAAIAAIDGMPIPTYVLHGGDDPLVPPDASAILEGKRNVTRRVHPGLRHECHHEPEHEDVLGEVVDWIRATIPEGGPGAGMPTPSTPAGTPAEAAPGGV